MIFLFIILIFRKCHFSSNLYIVIVYFYAGLCGNLIHTYNVYMTNMVISITLGSVGNTNSKLSLQAILKYMITYYQSYFYIVLQHIQRDFK